MSFETEIQQWVICDNHHKHLNQQTKIIRDKKNNICSTIHQYVEKNNLQEATIKLKDGKLKFKKTSVINPVSLGIIQSCLNNNLNDDNLINTIMDDIRNSRKGTEKFDIVRY